MVTMKSTANGSSISVKQQKKPVKTVGILLDTKGPEIRTNKMENGGSIEKGKNIIVSMKEVVGTTGQILRFI